MIARGKVRSMENTMSTAKRLLDGKPIVEIAPAKGRCHQVAIVQYGPEAYRVFVQGTNYEYGRDVTSWRVASGPKTVTSGEAYRLFDRKKR
jgi:hypothetical protein